MANAICFYFGYPFLEDINEDIYEQAVANDKTFNQAMLEYFAEIVKLSQIFHEENTCYFYSLLCEKIRPGISLPTILSGTYIKQKTKLPHFTFSTDHLHHKFYDELIFIDDELANHIGKRFEKSYGFEFIKYKRVKLNG
jgi:hypothetical protein